MKVKELTVKLPSVKPRDPNHLTLAAKKNAGGPMKDKKVAMKRGDFKHKGRAYEDMDLVEASLGSRMEYEDYDEWKRDLPKGSTFNVSDKDGKERAQAVGKDFEGVAGAWDHETDSGWIYEYYLKKSNLAEGRRHVYGPGDETLTSHPNKLMNRIGKGEEVKVMTKSGVAKILKVQFYNGGTMYKLDREVKLDDGSKSAWIADREVSLDLTKGAAPDAKTYAKRHAVGEAQLDEKKPAGAPDFHHSDAPDANGKFKELGVNDLADWLIKTRGGNLQKISGSLTQQIVFNRKKNPSYAKKMESVRNAVKRKLDKKKD